MKIALITASERPIPATLGGATQTMMNHLIDVNEEKGEHEFVIFSYHENQAELDSKKYKYSKFYFYRPIKKLDKIESIFYRTLRVLSNHKIYLRSNFIRFCAKHIREENVDVVVLQGNCFQAKHMRSLIDNKIILHMHIDRLNTELKESEDIINSVDGLIAISEFCKRKMLEVCPEKNDKIRVLKNTIDIDSFNKDDKDDVKKIIRKKIGATENQIIISYCGRLVEDKGVLELVKAIKQLNDKRLRLMIIGSSVYAGGKKTEYVKKLEKEAEGLVGGYCFTGYIPQKELPKYVKSSDIAVVPSICQEAAGNVTIEALACGVPVVASTQGGIPEYADESACELVPYNEDFISNIATAIHKLINNKDLYKAKCDNSRKVALKYSKHIYHTNFIDVVNKLCIK